MCEAEPEARISSVPLAFEMSVASFTQIVCVTWSYSACVSYSSHAFITSVWGTFRNKRNTMAHWGRSLKYKHYFHKKIKYKISLGRKKSNKRTFEQCSQLCLYPADRFDCPVCPQCVPYILLS